MLYHATPICGLGSILLSSCTLWARLDAGMVQVSGSCDKCKRSMPGWCGAEDKLWDSDMDIEKYLESSDEEIEAEEQDGSGGDKRLSPDEGEAPEISSKIGVLAPSFPCVV